MQYLQNLQNAKHLQNLKHLPKTLKISIEFCKGIDCQRKESEKELSGTQWGITKVSRKAFEDELVEFGRVAKGKIDS